MYIVGLDLGQVNDPSALCVLDVQGTGTQRTFDCRHLEQFLLGTSCPHCDLSKPVPMRACQLGSSATGPMRVTPYVRWLSTRTCESV
jgi:hypothetical protein